MANWVIWIPLAGEAALMLGFSADRRGWAQRHKLELAVGILTPPILPAGLQALRVLRLLRLLRLAVVVKLARRLFSVEGVKYAALLTTVVIVAGGYAYASAEKHHHRNRHAVGTRHRHHRRVRRQTSSPNSAASATNYDRLSAAVERRGS